jgi:sialic acid synthase SpsE
MGLRAIPAMQERFGVPVGLSDHSVFNKRDVSDELMGHGLGYGDSVCPVVAAALGASIIEKHIKIDDEQTLDADFSLNPDVFSMMAFDVRQAFRAVGQIMEGNGPEREEEPALALRRSIYATADIGKGEAFTVDNIACLRPDKGIAPSNYSGLIKGAHTTREIKAGQPVQWDDVGGEPCQASDQHSRAASKRQGNDSDSEATPTNEDTDGGGGSTV